MLCFVTVPRFVISLLRENCPALRYVISNQKRSRFRLAQFSTCRWAVRNWFVFLQVFFL